MASSRIFTANVVLARHRGGELTEFKVGDKVPEWALDMVGEHASQGVTRASDAPEPAEPINDTTAADEVAADAANDAADEAGDDDADDVDSYDSWTKDELKDEARAREIEGISKMNKEELIAALEADDAEED